MNRLKYIDDALQLATVALTGSVKDWEDTLENTENPVQVFQAATQLLGFLAGHEANRRGMSIDDIYQEIRLQSVEFIQPE